MVCTICRNPATANGKTTVTLERDNMMLVIKNVPAQVCENCGEAYVDEEITSQLLQVVEDSAKVGESVDIREFIAA